MENSIVKRIDDLGRITVPREFRMKFSIHEYDPIVMKLTENGILIKPYRKTEGLKPYLHTLRGAISELEWLTEKDKERLLEIEAAFETEIKTFEENRYE